MPRIPNRQPLSAQAAEVIVEMIDSGELQNRLPGERELAAQLQVGRDTLRAALDILEADEVISPRQHGKRREIYSTRARQRRVTRRIAFLSPKKLARLPPWMLVEFDTLRELLQRRDYELRLVSPGIFHTKSPEKKLKTLIEDTDADAWILYQCPTLVQQWFDHHKLPTLIRGYPQPEIKTPFIDEDWEAAAFHAGTQLQRLGHQRIGLLMPDSNLAGLKATKSGLCKAFPENDQSIVPIIEKGSAAHVATSLTRALALNDPPTAIVATRSRHTLSTISWATQNKLLIPRDLSLITLASEPWFEHLFPKPTHYFSDPATFAKAVVRQITLIAEGKSSQTSRKLLIPDYISGGTIAHRRGS